MIVLHGTWKLSETTEGRGNFFIWGESSVPPAKRRGRLPKTGQFHPFQASENDLRTVLETLDPEKVKKAQTDSALFNLPSYSKFPQASPELLREEIEEEGLSMRQWRVIGLCLAPEDAVSFLSSLTGMWAGEAAIGTDTRFWSKASKLAMELLSKQHFAPGIIVHDGMAFARWQYVLNDENDRMRFSMLMRSMPPVCRALVQNKFSDGQITFEDFFNSTVDSCIRSWISISEIKTRKPSLSKAWLHSLATGKPIEGRLSEIQKLSEDVSSWKASIYEIERSEFRTCFRLESPQDKDQNKWSLRYFLQASDDPSLLVPAENVWRESKDTLQFLNRKFDHPQEKLLADLGKAARLYLPIEDSLQSARPISMALTNRQAYAFLKESVPLLTESGFRVLIPPWWNKRPASLGVKLNLKPKRDPKTSRGIFGFDSIIRYDWQIAIGDEVISEEEFEALVNLKEPLIHIRGQWVEIKKEDIDAAIKYFKSRHSGEMMMGEALRLGTGLGESGTGLPVSSFKVSGWISELFERLSGRNTVEQLPQPDDFVGKLRPYQIKGFSWLAFLRHYGLGACLADDMGLGKTIQMLALLLRDKQKGIEKPVLLICPTSVVGNWKREAEKFAPQLRVMIHHGITRRKKNEFLADTGNYDLVISTYALAHRDEDILSRVEWNGVVLDEAQNIKNQFTKQSRAVRQIRSNYRIALTGTPVENRLSELWSIMEFLNPGYLGSQEGFRKRFALPIERYNDKEAGAELKKIISPFILRRLKTDPTIIKDLPDKIEMKVHCNLTTEQATLYEAVVDDMLKKIESSKGIERKGMVLSALMRLKQICNHPAQFLGDGSVLKDRSGKLNRITEMLEEVLSEGDAALIFTQFAEMGAILRNHLHNTFGQEVLFLHGGVSQKQRDNMIMRFSEKDGPRIFILSLKAGGVGLNLTRASHVFHFDRWWNPAVENQATDRAFRIGQTRNVQVHKFICDGTLEEKIDEMIEDKKALAENIVGTGEGWLTEMSTEQLKKLFILRHEAVMDE